MEIFISRSGERHGPYSLEQVNAWLTTGQVKPTEKAWYEGAGDWVEIWRVPGIDAQTAQVYQRKNDPKKIRREWFISLVMGFLMSASGFVLILFVALKYGNPLGEMNPQKLLSGLATGLLFGGLIFSFIYFLKLVRNR
jgi:hypothetical protein